MTFTVALSTAATIVTVSVVTNKPVDVESCL